MSHSLLQVATPLKMIKYLHRYRQTQRTASAQTNTATESTIMTTHGVRGQASSTETNQILNGHKVFSKSDECNGNSASANNLTQTCIGRRFRTSILKPFYEKQVNTSIFLFCSHAAVRFFIIGNHRLPTYNNYMVHIFPIFGRRLS